ncbi:MAG: sensor histidine kinase [Gaiellaceae bacterium]
MSPLRLLTRESRPAAVYFAGGLALIGAYYALPASSTGTSVIYEGLGAASVVATAVALRAYRPARPLPWILFALGNLCSAIGDVLFDVDPNASAPAASDVFYLAAYPFLGAGVVLLLVYAGGHHRLAAIAEAGIATFAFALLQWVFLMQPALAGSGTLAQRAIDATYPAGDVVLLAAFAGLFVSPAWRKSSFWLLMAAIAAIVVADEVYSLNPNGYATRSWLDSFWMLSYLCFGVAVLSPSMRDLAEPRRRAGLRVSEWRVALLSVALLMPPAVLVAQRVRHKPLEIPAIVIATTGISLLVVWRLTGILRALERLRLREREARADAEQAQVLLAEQNTRLLEADRLKDEFVALISHDLRTPLTSIIGYVELALDEAAEPTLDAERRAYLEVVARSSERLLRLVNDLLFVARLQAGRLVLDPAPVDLAKLGLEAVDEARPRAERKGVALSFLGESPVSIEADPGRLSQLLDNLVSNAIKFTPEGGRIDVRVVRSIGGAVLEVSDTGIGIPPRAAERIFDRFFRTDEAVDGQIPGTGLGLFIARAIVDAHGGRIAAVPRGTGGTTFRIELPAQVAAASAGSAERVA